MKHFLINKWPSKIALVFSAVIILVTNLDCISNLVSLILCGIAVILCIISITVDDIKTKNKDVK
jgi:hypothetical protein